MGLEYEGNQTICDLVGCSKWVEEWKVNSISTQKRGALREEFIGALDKTIKPALIKLTSANQGHSGHSIMFDPVGSRFYDQNFGWYVFANKQEAARVLYRHLGAHYFAKLNRSLAIVTGKFSS